MRHRIGIEYTVEVEEYREKRAQFKWKRREKRELVEKGRRERGKGV